jgi:DNA-binding transcriptional regulator YdaS (Cro superfamily)
MGNIMYTDDAVRYFGGRRQLAEALGITRQAVEQWGKIVAEGAAYKLQVITKGKLVVDPKKYGQ